MLAAGGTARAGRFYEYLHVEAGSGVSGGGHAAVRLADTTYHYVYAEPGLIESTAEPNESFDYAYRALGNRSIHVSRIAASEETYEALADAFERRHITQKAQLARLEAAERDAVLVAYLRQRHCTVAAVPGNDADHAGGSAPRLRGAGYFESASRAVSTAPGSMPPEDPTPMINSSAIVELRAAIERAHGREYLTSRARDIEGDIAGLSFSAPPALVITEGRIPPYEAGFAERYEALATASVALDILLHDRRPLPHAYRIVDDSAYRLTGDEIARLRTRAASLRSSLVRLAASRRTDWGYPMLVGMARLAALDASLRSGRLIVPDSFDDTGSWVAVETLLEDAPVVEALLRERQSDLATAREDLFASPPENELGWSRFEVASTAMLELREAIRRGHGAVRSYSDTMLPSRSAELDPAWPVPAADCDTVARWEASAQEAETSVRDRLREIYRYHVVSRNCVTELFRTMSGAGVTFGSENSADAGLGFVPFVSATAVNENYPVEARSTLPSYRTYWLARLRETHGRTRTALRESNTITATLRHPDDRDDVFLFYTEDARLLRPLYGAINVGVGAGATIAGLATLPFDDGRLLSTAVRSVVFSVPELAFVNFRKGRNGVLPRDWMQARAEGTGARRGGDPFPQSPSAIPRERAVVTASPSSGTFF